MTDYIEEVRTAWEIINSYEAGDGDFVEFNIRIELLQRTNDETDKVVDIQQGIRDPSYGVYPKSIQLNENQCQQMVDILNLALDRIRGNEV